MAGPRDTKRYTEHQIQALMHSMLITGNTPAMTVRLAERGELGVPAFHVDTRYIYQLRDNNRDQFEANNPEALARATNLALIRAHKLNLDALRNLATDADPAERTRLAKSLADTSKLLNTEKPRTTREPEPHANAKQDTSEAVNTSDSTLSSLLDLANTGANTGKPAKQAGPVSKPVPVGARTGSVSRTRTSASA